jgi:uncharacterized protein
MIPSDFRQQVSKKGVIVALRVTPRASKNEILEILGDGTVRIRITAPPVEGKANAALLKFLAKVLEVPVSKLELIAGANGRDKRVFVADMGETVLHKKILENLRNSHP